MGFSTYAKASASVKAGGGVPASQATSSSAWHPTIVYLAALTAAEFLVLGFLSHYLLKED